MTREQIQENNRRALEGGHHPTATCNCEFETFVRPATIIRQTLYHRDSIFGVGEQGKSQPQAVLRWMPLFGLLMSYLGYILDDSEFLLKRAHLFRCFTGEETSAWKSEYWKPIDSLFFMLTNADDEECRANFEEVLRQLLGDEVFEKEKQLRQWKAKRGSI